jgi:peptide-methionine (S)-S-oxide reductase
MADQLSAKAFQPKQAGPRSKEYLHAMARYPRRLALQLIFIPLLLMTTDLAATSSARASLVVGGGCFWCLEALYERIEGVHEVVSGYAGGTSTNPTYQQVGTGATGHAEVVRIDFDPTVVSSKALLEFFWEAHDPTTLNRQGADVGTQYRSIILYADADQKKDALATRDAAQQRLAQPIVTEIVPLDTFYPAEGYHQDYFRNNPDAPYCRYVIAPKLKKLEQ